MKDYRSSWIMGGLASMLLLGLYFVMPAGFASPTTMMTAEATPDVRATIYASRETEMAIMLATNSAKLTALAPVGLTATPDLRVSHSANPQRLAGNGVIIESGFMGHGPLSRTNEWVGYVNDRIVSVLAGAKYKITGAPSDTGELIVAEYDQISGEKLSVRKVYSERDTGAFSILDVDGPLLILTTTHQQIMAFDLAKWAFVDVVVPNEPITRQIGGGVLELEAKPSSAADTPQLVWKVELNDAQSVTMVRLVTGRGEQNWSLSIGEGTSAGAALANTREITNGPDAATMRVFDIRGQSVLFVAGRKTIWVYDVDTGVWSNGEALFEMSQPNYLRTQVPVYVMLLSGTYPRSPDPTGTPIGPEVATGYP